MTYLRNGCVQIVHNQSIVLRVTTNSSENFNIPFFGLPFNIIFILLKLLFDKEDISLFLTILFV